MRIPRLKLSPGLSKISWFFIELFFLVAVFFLPFSKSVAETTLAIALFLWILRKWPWDEPFPGLRHCTIPYAIFFGIVLVSLSRIPHAQTAIGLRGALKWLKYLGVFFLCAELSQDEKRRDRLVAGFLVSTAFLCADSLYQMALGRDFVKHHSLDVPGPYARLQGPLDSPNNLACFLLIALPLLFYFWLKEGRWSSKSLVCFAVLTAASLVFAMTLSRSGFVSLVAAATVYLLLHRKKYLLALATSAALGIVILSNHLNLHDITVSERLRYWHITWDMIRSSPLWGHGVNMYYLKFGTFAPASESYRGYAHNCYLQMWSEIGILGFLAFVWPLGTMLVKPLTGLDKKAAFSLTDALWIGLVAYLFQSFVDTNFYSYQMALVFWIFWGVYTALANKDSLGYNSFHQSS